MSKVVVHIAETRNFSDSVISRLRKFAIVKQQDVGEHQVQQSLRECDVFWFRLGFRIGAKHLAGGVRCRFIVCPVTGLDHIDLEACRNSGIEVLSLRGETGFLKTIRATAEHTLGLTLSLLRHLNEAAAHVRQGNWNRDLFKGSEIYGKRVGILGVGRLGSITAGFFKALGADVWGYDKSVFDPSVCKKAETIEHLFKFSDILSIHLSYNEGTNHLVSKSLIRLMQSHAVLINTARGGIIKSDDLLWALKNNIISGAALDVLENEYDINQDQLVSFSKTNNNLIITPHIGGNTVESFAKTEMFLCQKLEKALGVLVDNES